MQFLAGRRSAAARQEPLVDLTTEAPEAELAACHSKPKVCTVPLHLIDQTLRKLTDVLLQILAVRRNAAARQGLLVDLTTEAPEAELAAAQAELEALERAEDEAQRTAAAANKRKALEEALVRTPGSGNVVGLVFVDCVGVRCCLPHFLYLSLRQRV